jgi:hypothetical protein
MVRYTSLCAIFSSRILHRAWQHTIKETEVPNMQNCNPPKLDSECSYWWQKPMLGELETYRLDDEISFQWHKLKPQLQMSTSILCLVVFEYQKLLSWLPFQQHKKLYHWYTSGNHISKLILQWQQFLYLLSLWWQPTYMTVSDVKKQLCTNKAT